MLKIAALILTLMTPAPNRTLYKDAEARREMAGYFVEAGEYSEVPAGLLVVWFMGESSLRVNRVGKLGEVGISQIHPCNWNKCKRNGHDLETAKGQIMCGAMLMAKSRDACGSLRAGLYEYASGKCKGTPAAHRLTRRRLRQWHRMK